METPKESLKKLTAWDTEPELSEDELDELLAGHSRADADGVSPEDVDWEPTYDLNAAAAAGWLIKAGRSSGTTETDPETIAVTSRVFENCLKLAGIYSAKRSAAPGVIK